MARHTGPRVNTIAHKIMCRLVDLGGKATKTALMSMMDSDQQSTANFRVKVANVLERYGFVVVDQFSLTATTAGKNYVAECIERCAPPVPQNEERLATPRIALPIKPLNLTKHMPRMPRREGSMDFLKLPSIMGNQRVTRACGWRRQ